MVDFILQGSQVIEEKVKCHWLGFSSRGGHCLRCPHCAVCVCGGGVVGREVGQEQRLSNAGEVRK